jgi:ABC-type transport system involved in multi-copper enzyme maturation permease subunit
MKETRELLVILIGMPLLIAVPFLINGANGAPFGVGAFALGCVVLGGCAFGNEFQHRTLPLLLSQPISRSALWRDKMLVLGIGIAFSLAVLLVCQQVYGAAPDQGPPVVAVWIALCAFCGAPYWTLVCRQTLVGTVCAAGFPAALLAICALIGTLLGQSEPVGPVSAAILLALYCAAVLLGGHGLFRTLEVVDSVATDLRLPVGVETAVARPLARLSSGFSGPFATLLKKEFRLQQVSFLLAGIFFLIAVIGFCVFPLYQPLSVGMLGGDFVLFMIVLPLVVGAIAVAEEKGWGLAEWHLTLPPSASHQWAAKVLVALPTSLGLGLLLPAIMFLTGEALLPRNVHRPAIPPLSALALVALAQVLVTSVAIYAASFSKTTLKAIIATLGILALSYGVIALVSSSAGIGYVTLVGAPFLLRGYSPQPFVAVSLLLLLGLTQWFAWCNFRRAGAPGGLIIRQLLLLLFAAAVGSTVILTLAQMAR